MRDNTPPPPSATAESAPVVRAGEPVGYSVVPRPGGHIERHRDAAGYVCYDVSVSA